MFVDVAVKFDTIYTIHDKTNQIKCTLQANVLFDILLFDI